MLDLFFSCIPDKEIRDVYIDRIIRIFHVCEVRTVKSVPRDSCLSSRGFAPNNHDILFFLHTFRAPAFDFNVGAAMNESRSLTLASDIMKIDVVCDVAMMSTPNVLTRELRNLPYNNVLTTRVFILFLSVPRVG